MGHRRGCYRNYSDEDKASVLATLAACDGNVYRAAKETGVPRKTLEEWDKRTNGLSDAVAEIAIDKKIEMGDWFENHARKALAYADYRLEDPEVPYSATITGAAIAIDKMRLLRDQSTANTVVSIEQVQELLATARARRLAAQAESAIEITPDSEEINPSP